MAHFVQAEISFASWVSVSSAVISPPAFYSATSGWHLHYYPYNNANAVHLPQNRIYDTFPAREYCLRALLKKPAARPQPLPTSARESATSFQFPAYGNRDVSRSWRYALHPRSTIIRSSPQCGRPIQRPSCEKPRYPLTQIERNGPAMAMKTKPDRSR